MSTWKRYLALLLCAALLFGQLPAAFAEETADAVYETGEEAAPEEPQPEPAAEEPAPAEPAETAETPDDGGEALPTEETAREETDDDAQAPVEAEPESDEPTELIFETLEGDFPNDALFDQYVRRIFYPDYAQRPLFNSAAPEENLTEAEYSIEQQLKAAVGEVAAGQRTSTRIYANLGGADYNELNMRRIVYTLLKDCPLEMYWFSRSWARGQSGTRVLFVFYVAPDYAVYDEGADKPTKVDSEKVALAQLAAANARGVVAQYEGCSDLERLRAYKDAICARVDYNYAAVGSSVGSIGSDPWELVAVFDDDPDTTVVCEGYAKAFAYLCDQTTFNSSRINAYCVDGDVAWLGGGGGGHMWNLVTMEDGRNYIVDVTSCDSHYDKDFSFLLYALSGEADKPGGYTVSNGDTYSYYLHTGSTEGADSYTSNTVDAYPKRMLWLSAWPYGASEWDLNLDGSVDAGDTVALAGILKTRGEGHCDSFGDINGDGAVNGADLVALSRAIG